MTKFKELRLNSGLTQESFRAQFNNRFQRSYTAAAISQFENGKRMPEVSALMDFAEFYGVSVDYLLGRDVAREKLSKEQKSILHLIEGLNEEHRKSMLDYLKFLLQSQLDMQHSF